MLKLFSALAVAALVSITSAQAQILDKPVLLGDANVYQMEDEAKVKWAEVLPRIYEGSFSDYYDAWMRMQTRQKSARQKWFEKYLDTNAEKQGRELHEMSDWCATFMGTRYPIWDSSKVADIAAQFARLEVRVRLCEEKLPQKAETKSVVAPKAKTKKRR